MRRLHLAHALLPSGWAADVAVDLDDTGSIAAVTPDAPPADRERVSGIVVAGLPNLHSHTFQRAMAGLAETRGPAGDSFWTWREVMYRFLGVLGPDDVEAVAAFAFMEMLEAGFTAVAEFHYLHHAPDGRPYANLAELSERIAAAAAATGIGLTLLPSLYAHGGMGGAPPTEGQRRFLNDPDRFLKLVEGARRAISRLPDAGLGIAPHSLRAVAPAELSAVLAACPTGPVHIHAAEQTREVEDCLAWSGKRPVAWLLDEVGLDARWCVIHATHMDPIETRRLAESGAVAGLCPLTEASLGDGIFEGALFAGAGGRYGVGSDSNIEITAPGELKQLEYAQRLTDRARNVMALTEGASTGRRLYGSALAGGAQALGRQIGQLAPGFRADLVVLDHTHADLATVSGDRWLDAYIFTAGKSAVAHVSVGGRDLVSGGRHLARAAIRERYLDVLARLN